MITLPTGIPSVFSDWRVGYAIPLPQGYRKPRIFSRLLKGYVELQQAASTMPTIFINRYGHATESEYLRYLAGFGKHLSENGDANFSSDDAEIRGLKVRFFYFTQGSMSGLRKCIVAAIHVYEQIVEIGVSDKWTLSESEFAESDRDAFRTWIATIEVGAS
jgi:hypothetical protein